MALNFLPGIPYEPKPRIAVIGVGGAGGNAVNHMIASRLKDVEFVIADTDTEALAGWPPELRIHLDPDIARRQCAVEGRLSDLLYDRDMVFVLAGMGGRAGSGAAPGIATAAREMGICTIAVVTRPFDFEGAHRFATAETGINELSQNVDGLIFVPGNNRGCAIIDPIAIADTFKKADRAIGSTVRMITDLLFKPGLTNLNFDLDDIRAIVCLAGCSSAGSGRAVGDSRAIEAADAALRNSMSAGHSMREAKGVLFAVRGGSDMTMSHIDAVASRIHDDLDPKADIIFGPILDESMCGILEVSLIAGGLPTPGHLT